jgi:hypothetical protein
MYTAFCIANLTKLPVLRHDFLKVHFPETKQSDSRSFSIIYNLGTYYGRLATAPETEKRRKLERLKGLT